MSKTIVLVGCSKRKSASACPAKELYQGNLFKAARAYAEKFGEDWRILSAYHEMLNPDQLISPYDTSLHDLSKTDLDLWGYACAYQIRRHAFSQGYKKVVILAGSLYRNAIMPYLRECEVTQEITIETPLMHMGIGQQIAWLKGEVK